MKDVQQLTINAIRVLSAEAIQKAKSGHPGMPLGAAPIGYSIFTNMVFNPKDTKFDNRDRFVLSAGHASMLDYSLYYLFEHIHIFRILVFFNPRSDKIAENSPEVLVSRV